VLADDEADQFLATSTDEHLAPNSDLLLTYTGKEPIISNSGDREFDYALAQTLSRIADTFQVLPGFAYFDDFEAPQAYAIPIARLKRADGTVLFGQRLLKVTLAQPDNPDVGVAAICAHEFAHILQFKLNLTKKLREGQTTVKRSELHADYLAGYYAGTWKLKKPDYPAAVVAATVFDHGDRKVNNPKHHGTPDERAAAVVRGFEVAYRERHNLAQAVQIGINYVSTL
jgi:hypothetical protein